MRSPSQPWDDFQPPRMPSAIQRMPCCDARAVKSRRHSQCPLRAVTNGWSATSPMATQVRPASGDRGGGRPRLLLEQGRPLQPLGVESAMCTWPGAGIQLGKDVARYVLRNAGRPS
ncbi:hypothetical protein [Streptomyces sp. NPDC057740]|uniref:hypothetical protein n=1 Tax=Streptomyces sp. NPDC057740 TaxID=3346234 RepID=UPI0036CB28E4